MVRGTAGRRGGGCAGRCTHQWPPKRRDKTFSKAERGRESFTEASRMTKCTQFWPHKAALGIPQTSAGHSKTSKHTRGPCQSLAPGRVSEHHLENMPDHKTIYVPHSISLHSQLYAFICKHARCAHMLLQECGR